MTYPNLEPHILDQLHRSVAAGLVVVHLCSYRHDPEDIAAALYQRAVEENLGDWAVKISENGDTPDVRITARYAQEMIHNIIGAICSGGVDIEALRRFNRAYTLGDATGT